MNKDCLEDLIQLLGSLPNDMIWVMDSDLKMKYISPNVVSIRGMSQEESLAEPFMDKFTPASQSVIVQLVETIIDSVVKNEPPKLNTVTVEMYKKDKSIIMVEISFQIKVIDGKIKHIAGVTRDISDRINNEKLKLTGELARMFSDQLSQPIHVLTSLVTLMSDPEVPNFIPPRYIALMNAQLEILHKIVRTVQEVNKENVLDDPLYLSKLNQLNNKYNEKFKD